MSATTLLALVSLVGAAAPPADPPVKLWLNPSYGFERGDRVRVDARADADGYLLVLHADPSGRIRVLFPLDPFEDSFVRGGHKFEIRGRGDRQAFTIYESSGVGTVLAAWSADPFNVAELVRGDHWDYTLASTWQAGDDAETYLVGLAQRLVASAHFDYDVLQYDVGAYVAYGRPYRRYHIGLYPDYYDRVGFSFSVGWGSPYWSSWSYHPYWYGYHYDPFYYSGWSDWWGPYSPYPYCVGWCSWRTYYHNAWRYHAWGWGYPRTVVYNSYYFYRSPGVRYGSGGYTFKLNGQPRLVAEPRQRAPLASALSRRLVTEPVGVVTGRRTLAEPGRRLVSDQAVTGRQVRPAIGGTQVRRTVEQPDRAGVRDRATVTTPTTPRRVEPGRATTRDRTVVPADQTRPEPRRVDPRDRALTTERTTDRSQRSLPEPRRVDRTEQSRTPSERPSAQERPEVRERGRTEVQPRLEPRRAPPRETPERSARPSRGDEPPSVRSTPQRSPERSGGPTVRSAPSRSPGGSARPSVRSGPSRSPSRPSGSSGAPRSGGSSSGGGRRRG
jgi:hypothetical protein